MPSVNFTPSISFGNWLWPSRRRQAKVLLAEATGCLGGIGTRRLVKDEAVD
jgi:hypothetical protein